jgi:membrane-associated phospholipid phosphatase
MLARLYPQATATFWALALICAVLRYIMDAHWPSDVLGGIALGYALANVTANAMHLV